MLLSRLLTVAALLPVLALAACGEPKDDASSSSTATTTAASAATCQKANLDLVAGGKLTIGTDKPAYPPYFEDDDPTNGKGFESAVGYAIADELGFSKDEVSWKTVPFNSAYAPGKKTFDIDLNQVSISDARKKAVDFSSAYFEAPQAVVVPKGSKLTSATLASLKDAKLGVQIGTTSLQAVTSSIAPSTQPKVYDTSNDVVTALKQGQVDAVVVDLPTAFYLTGAQVEGSSILGHFDAPGGDRWGAVLAKGSSLTSCVSFAVDALQQSGELQKINDRWLSAGADAPVLK
ncbi:ABC transporter substrate-binding protein [Patulibacter sp.]|uniref:ABC transporter substrate-binding protein n=1 Tax=Patulibacter sp. TaxID=1912859 RepID=UPI002727A474|nr:ABC transporter substrate-binding protein [Patulibacter sp.]MDO9408370.1 ABC transporter substrate-binding protein [Patulibacter sp.]